MVQDLAPTVEPCLETSISPDVAGVGEVCGRGYQANSEKLRLHMAARAVLRCELAQLKPGLLSVLFRGFYPLRKNGVSCGWYSAASKPSANRYYSDSGVFVPKYKVVPLTSILSCGAQLHLSSVYRAVMFPFLHTVTWLSQ